jgi:hypothetical protein
MTFGSLLTAGAKAFAVVTMSLGVGFLAGAIAYANIDGEGRIFGGLFHHIGDAIGWGAGFLTASVATFGLIFFGKKEPRGKLPGHGLE